MNAIVTQAKVQASNELIIVKNGTPVVSHIVIAENTGNDKKSIARTIDTYSEQLEEFGKVGFEITPIKNAKNKINQLKEYLLNENQVTFLMTLLKNSKIVVQFKLNLVKAFSKLRNKQLEEPQFNDMLPSEMIRQAANLMAKASMDVRKLEQATVDYVKENRQLKANNNKYKELQSNISKLGREELNITIEQFAKNLGTTRPALFSLLRYNHYLTLKNLPYKAYLNKLFVIKPANYMRGDKITSYKQTLVTPKGVQFLTGLINQNALS